MRTWFTRTKAQTRTNAIIHDDENRRIHVSSPGAEVLPDEVAALELSIFDLRDPEFLVIAGGLLKGMPEDFYRTSFEGRLARTSRWLPMWIES